MTRLFAFALMITLSLAACRKEAAPPATAADPAAAAAAPAAQAAPANAPGAEAKPGAALTVVGVDTGLAAGDDNKLVDRGTSFKPTATVVAAITLHNSSPLPVKGMVTARWEGPDGSVVNEESQDREFSAETTINFRIADPNGLRKGNYLLKVLLNGSQVETRGFSID